MIEDFHFQYIRNLFSVYLYKKKCNSYKIMFKNENLVESYYKH